MLQINQFNLNKGPYEIDGKIYILTEIITHTWQIAKDQQGTEITEVKPMVVIRDLENVFVDKKWVLKNYTLPLEDFKLIAKEVKYESPHERYDKVQKH